MTGGEPEEIPTDAAAVVEVLHHYARAVDRRDFDSLAACYTSDVVLEVSNRGIVARGRKELLDVAESVLSRYDRTHHMITNESVLISGGGARLSAYAQTTHVASDPLSIATTGGVYEITLCLTVDGWQMNHVTLHEIWRTENGIPSDATPAYEPPWRWEAALSDLDPSP